MLVLELLPTRAIINMRVELHVSLSFSKYFGWVAKIISDRLSTSDYAPKWSANTGKKIKHAAVRRGTHRTHLEIQLQLANRQAGKEQQSTDTFIVSMSRCLKNSLQDPNQQLREREPRFSAIIKILHMLVKPKECGVHDTRQHTFMNILYRQVYTNHLD